MRPLAVAFLSTPARERRQTRALELEARERVREVFRSEVMRRRAPMPDSPLAIRVSEQRPLQPPLPARERHLHWARRTVLQRVQQPLDSRLAEALRLQPGRRVPHSLLEEMRIQIMRPSRRRALALAIRAQQRVPRVLLALVLQIPRLEPLELLPLDSVLQMPRLELLELPPLDSVLRTRRRVPRVLRATQASALVGTRRRTRVSALGTRRPGRASGSEAAR